MNNDISAHLNQEFPPHLPEGWVLTAPFAISRQGREIAKVVAAVKSLHLPPHYLVEVPTMFGRAYLDLEGVRHVGRSPYKHKNPPFIEDFNAAVALAESYLDGSLTVGAIVEDTTPA